MIISKNKMTLIDLVFPKLRTPKTWLDKCLKSPVLEAPATSSMVNGPKRCWNLRHSTVIIFIDHYQDNWVRESLSCSHAKFWDCFLTHWLLLARILVLILTINDTNSDAIISETKKLFSLFFSIFEIEIKF